MLNQLIKLIVAFYRGSEFYMEILAMSGLSPTIFIIEESHQINPTASQISFLPLHSAVIHHKIDEQSTPQYLKPNPSWESLNRAN